MAGYSGRLIVEGDVPDDVLGVAFKHAEKLRVWKQTQELSSASKAFDLGQGYYCVVLDIAGMRTLQVVAPTAARSNTYGELPTVEYETSDTVGVYDVISGKADGYVIRKVKIEVPQKDGTVEEQEVGYVPFFTPTTATASRYTDFERGRRLAVKEHPSFRPIDAPDQIEFSIHAHVKPSCYTGTMRKLAQFALGIGRVREPTYETKWRQSKKRGSLPDKLTDSKTNKLSKVDSAFGLSAPTPKYPDFFSQDPQGGDYYVPYLYDYRFAKTHGVSFDSANKPWLVEISTRGVYAMPIYLDPVSTTVEGRERYLELSPELEEVFNIFGGFPLGVCFPIGAAFEEWKRAGEIVELISGAQMQTFYDKEFHTTAIGWAFNNKGSEAHNTCKMLGTDGVYRGYWYSVNFALTPEPELPELTGKRAELAGKFFNVWQINKCRRMSETDASGILRAYAEDPDQGYQAFRSFTVPPPEIGAANLRLMKMGKLLTISEFKMPEPLMGGLISVYAPKLNSATSPPKFNTPIFVCFIDDELDVVYAFTDARPRTIPPAENTREECQYTGSWTSTTFGGDSILVGRVYSSRFDWREEITFDDTVTTFTARKIGTYGYAYTEFYFEQCISVSSITAFWIKYVTQSVVGRMIRIGGAVPFNNRNCYYMSRVKTASATYKTTGGYSESVLGPRTDLYRVHEFYTHWFGICSAPMPANGKVTCVAKKTGELFRESCVSETIPPGFFYSACPGPWPGNPPAPIFVNTCGNTDIGPTYESSCRWPKIVFPSPYTETVETSLPEKEGEIWMACDGGFGPIRTYYEKIRGTADLQMSDQWIALAGNDPILPYLAMTQSCLGSSIINYMPDFAKPTAKRGAPQNMQGDITTTYTGVIL